MKWPKAFSIFVIGFLAFGFLATFAFVSPTHAANPTVTLLNSANVYNSGASLANAITVTASTTLIAEINIGGDGTGSTFTVSSIGDTLGLTWTKYVQGLTVDPAGKMNKQDFELWYAQAGSSSGADTVTATWSGSIGTSNGGGFAIDQISQKELPAFQNSVSGTSNCPAGNTCPVTNLGQSVSIPANTVVIGLSYAEYCQENAGLACSASVGTSTYPDSFLSNNVNAYNTGSGNAGYGTRADYYFQATAVSQADSYTYTIPPVTNPGILVTTDIFSYWNAAGSIAPAGNPVQTIGSCPKAGNGHVTPANSTQYWYSGNALGSEVVNTVQTEVSSVKGSSAQNIQLVLYVSTAQTPSAQNPATLAWYQIVSVSAGTTNSTITFQVNIPLNTIASGTLPFNFWAVGIVGNDHVYIVQSTLSGMTTQSGSAAGSVQPYSFTSAGSASALKMGLCATGNYQSVLPAVTTTVTTGGTTSTTVSTTTTATISTIGPALFSTASNWPVIFLILLLPAGLFLGVTRSLAGALLGLAVGSVIGLMMGIIPTFVFAGILIALVAVAFVSRERSP